MLRASEVTAVLRLTSLVRGGLEIARLDLTEPSLNLVHGENGRWNLEALLERTAHTPLAPTAKAKSEPRPGFPYIAGHLGPDQFQERTGEKTVRAHERGFFPVAGFGEQLGRPFESAALAQRSELERHGRAASERHVAARGRRFATRRCSSTWSGTGAQLGQLTKLFTGNDQGWRGEVLLEVTLAGTPAKLHDQQRRVDRGFSPLRHYQRRCAAHGRSLRRAI